MLIYMYVQIILLPHCKNLVYSKYKTMSRTVQARIINMPY